MRCTSGAFKSKAHLDRLRKASTSGPIQIGVTVFSFTGWFGVDEIRLFRGPQDVRADTGSSLGHRRLDRIPPEMGTPAVFWTWLCPNNLPTISGRSPSDIARLAKLAVGREMVLCSSFDPDSLRQWENSRFAEWVPMNMARSVG